MSKSGVYVLASPIVEEEGGVSILLFNVYLKGFQGMKCGRY